MTEIAADISPDPNTGLIGRPPFHAIAAIITEVAKDYGFTIAMMVGERRSRSIVIARQLAYWRASRETGASLAAIGRAFGDRDHTTILHGIRRHEQRMSRAAKATAVGAR